MRSAVFAAKLYSQQTDCHPKTNTNLLPLADRGRDPGWHLQQYLEDQGVEFGRRGIL